MDADNAPDTALAAGHARPGKRLCLPAGARWRQRPARSHRAAVGVGNDEARRAAPPIRSAPPRQANATVDAPEDDTTGQAARAELDHDVTTAEHAPGERCADPGRGSPVDIDIELDPGVEADVDIGFGGDGDGDDDDHGHNLEPEHVPALGPSSPSASAGGDVAVAESGTGQADGDDAAGATEAADDPTPPPASDEPRLASRDIELWLLARRTHGAALSLDFELRTVLARQVFRRDFVYVSRQLHALEACRRVQGLDRARLDGALAGLRRRADEIQRFLEDRATALKSAIECRGPAGVRIAFVRPARFQATIVSPTAHRFLSLLMLADEALARLEMAWLLGLVDPATRSALVSDCRRALLGFKDLACNQRHAMGELVRDVNAQRKEGLAMPPNV